MLSVVCVDVGEPCGYLDRGRQYVDALYHAVRRHLSVPHRFVCFTDNMPRYGLHPYHVRLVPSADRFVPSARGYMNKLALFRPGVFAEGERVLYLDLDTVITGSLDDIASYDGEFAMLQDLMFPQLRASGVMAWRGRFGGHIWESYAAAGFPRHVNFEGFNYGGDGAWIMQHAPNADVLQDLYPGQIASYKMSGGVLAPQTRVVCFHGVPRPHEIETGWVPALWSGRRPGA
jgi:hypothetical protein